MPARTASRNRRNLAAADARRQLPAMLRLPQLGVGGLAAVVLALANADDSRAQERARAPVEQVASGVARAAADSQAELGRRWFAASCEECHAVDEVASADFKAKWGGRTAYDLFDQIARTMPEDTPGSLPRRAYVDIVAYLMQQNGVVAVAPLADDDAALAAAVLQFAPPPVVRR